MKRTLIIFLYIALFTTLSNAQQRWMKTYLEDLDATRSHLITTYDKGYILTGRCQPNYPRYNYLIKTDINGEVLWQKTLGDGVNVILPWGTGMNAEGSIYFSGSYGVVGSYADPLIMKLNSCGEKEWCYLFPTEGHTDYGFGLTVTPDGGVAFIITNSGEDYIDDRVCLARFASDGTFLWKKCYNLDDTVAMDNEIAYEVITTPDSGFLLTGDTRYSNPGDSVGYFCPYYIKTDADGELEWYNVAGFHPLVIAGEGRQTVISPDSNYYYSAIRHNFWNKGNRNGSSPAMLKMDMQGNEVAVYDIGTANTYGTMSSIAFINDSTISTTAGWGSSGFNDKIYKLDSLGNILKQKLLIGTQWPGLTEVTYDEKLLYFVETVDQDDNFDVFLFKLNQDLESDSVYNQWFNYDSLCQDQIVSDTIPIEGCGLIVGNDEIYPDTKTKDVLEVFPNPTSKSFVVKSAYMKSGGILQLINMQGQNVMLENVPSGTTNYQVDVSGLTKGIYLVRFKSDKGKEVTAKLVVE